MLPLILVVALPTFGVRPAAAQFGPPPSVPGPTENYASQKEPPSSPWPPPAAASPPQQANFSGPVDASKPLSNPTDVSAPLNLFEPAQQIARVGSEPIFLGEVLGNVNQILEPYQGKYPDEEIERQRQKLIQQLLPFAIDTKLLYLDFLRDFPDKTRLPEVEKSVYEQFDKTQLELLMKKTNVTSIVELDAKLRSYGSSLQKTRRAFYEQVLGQQMLKRKVNLEQEISHGEMLDYYYAHVAEYAIGAKVRWEELMVRFDRFPSKEDAYRELALMGNEVLRGAPLAAVAKRRSQGFNASEGGYFDWTNQGSLASKILDKNLFELPIGRLSAIIEDAQGFHIIRVVERTEATRVPFEDAQSEIKKKLIDERVNAQRDKYVADLRERTPVWTIFEGERNAGRTADRSAEIPR